MRKPRIAVRQSKNKKHPFVVDLRGYGKGRKFFRFRADAEAEALRQRTLLERHSREAVGMSQREMSEIIHARQQLTKHGETLQDAVKFRLDYLERILRSDITVARLADEVLQSKQKDGLSAKYLVGLKFYFKRFCRDFGARAIATITVEELDHWLRSLPGSPKSRMDFRANVSVLFGHALKRRIIDTNPIQHTARPKLIDSPPEIFTVDELQSLLEAAATHEPSALPMLAIGAFAGLREAEIQRLHWNEIHLVRGHIEVTAAKAKSARRRIVPIQPNLAAWLRPYSGMSGNVVPKGARKKLLSIRKAAGLVKWPVNGLRHSFASYRLAQTHDAPRVSMELGHTNPQMLYSNYRELVHPEEAERYWKITPAAEAANVMALTLSGGGQK